MAAVLGSLVSLPLLANGRLKRTSVVPFGPFLIIAAIAVQLFGADILRWYQQTFINL
jgi:prepilin signal peptidase PulO-like enzyme (type II secretory pathway)